MSLLKKIMSLGIAGMILLGYPSNISFAMTEDDIQEAQGESGYRLYADELTPTAGVIKGDISGVLPDNEIINVRQPDGSVVLPQEVNYPITESGDYTFEIIYEVPVDDTETTEAAKIESILPTKEEENASESIQNTSVTEQSEKIETPEDIKNGGGSESNETDKININTEQPVSKEINSVTETLTLTVKLLELENEEEIKEEMPQKTEELSDLKDETGIQNGKAFNKQESKVSNITDRASGDDGWSNSSVVWKTKDFGQKWLYGSNQHIDNGLSKPPEGSVKLGSIGSKDTKDGAKFTFGTHLGGDANTGYWLQQGNAFSDITFNFDYDFAIKGAMRIGSAFKGLKDSVDSKDFYADGGATISFIPSHKVATAQNNSREGRGVAYRLGAFGTMPNSIICEFDTSSDTYYSPSYFNSGDKRNFEIRREHFQQIGDFKYINKSLTEGGNNIPELNDQDIYELAKDKVAYGGKNYENLSHIGISATGDNGYVQNSADETQASRRVSLGTVKTGIMNYEIRYSVKTKEIVYKLFDPNGYPHTVRMNLSSFLQKPGAKTDYKLAFSFGAAYINVKNYEDGSFFADETGQGANGTIDIYAKELSASPDLKVDNVAIRWLEDPYLQVGSSEKNNAYWKNQTNYTDRKLWPVAGDRIYAQFAFDPHTSLVTDKINTGSMNVEVKNLVVKDKNNTDTGLVIQSPTIYYKIGDGKWTDTNGKNIPVNGKDKVNLRFKIQLPKIDSRQDLDEYYVSGDIKAIYTVGGKTVTYDLPIMPENNEKINVSRPPKFIEWNGNDYQKYPRIIKGTDNVDKLRHTDNAGSKTGTGTGGQGRPKSFHYGVGYKLLSLNSDTNEFSMYNTRNGAGNYDVKQFMYKTASMDDVNNIQTVNNPKLDDPNSDVLLNVNDEDRRFVLEYRLQDPNYMKANAQLLTGNPDRGKATGKRVIWASDNVGVSNGYEFFAEQNVIMSKKDFDGFTSTKNKKQYYNKIAKAAGAKIFKTSEFSFENKVLANFSNVTGNGIHDGVEDALKKPGTPQKVTLEYIGENNLKINRNINLTILDDTPKVVSVDTGKATDTKAEKVIFSKENFELSATFKLVDDNGDIVDYNDLSEKNAVKVALYKMNPVKNPTSNDKYKRWANRTNADNEGQDTTTQGKKDKLVTPKNDKIVDNGNGTFTVTYTLLDDPLDGSIQMDWITEKWDHLSEYRIYCWTDSNGENINYGDLSHTGTDSVNRSDINDKVPSVTTKMYLHSKDDQGNLPSAMFKVPTKISLYENGDSVENFGEDLTITFAGEYDPIDSIVQHDSRYSVIAQTNRSSKPFVEMRNSKENFNAYYYKQNGKTFDEIKDSNTPLGVIGFDSNGDTPSLRFGLKGKKPSNTNKNDVYKGTATFKFTREKIIK